MPGAGAAPTTGQNPGVDPIAEMFKNMGMQMDPKNHEKGGRKNLVRIDLCLFRTHKVHSLLNKFLQFYNNVPSKLNWTK